MDNFCRVDVLKSFFVLGGGPSSVWRKEKRNAF